MKNILQQNPFMQLSGRIKFTVDDFVKVEDIKNKNVLNVGCGYGWFENWALNQKVKKITGIEISESDLKTAKQLKNPNAIFKVGSAIKIPFPDNSFDTVVSWEVLEHIPKNTENKMFAEVARVLKKNGVFYLSTPHQNFFYCIFDPAWWLIGHRHYKKEQIENFSKNNHFKMQKFILRGGWWEIVFMLNLYIAKWIFRRQPFLEEMFKSNLNQEYSKPGFATIFTKFRK